MEKLFESEQTCNHQPRIGRSASGRLRHLAAFRNHRMAAVFPIPQKSYGNHSGNGEKRIGRGILRGGGKYVEF